MWTTIDVDVSVHAYTVFKKDRFSFIIVMAWLNICVCYVMGLGALLTPYILLFS